MLGIIVMINANPLFYKMICCFFNADGRRILRIKPRSMTTSYSSRFANAFWAAWTKATTAAGSFLPGLDSTPLAVSTAAGRTWAMTWATFDGVSPPAKTSGGKLSSLGYCANRPIGGLARSAVYALGWCIEQDEFWQIAQVFAVV